MAQEETRCTGFPNLNLAQFQIDRMKTYGTSIALIDAKTKLYYTYADIIDRIQRLAAGLRDIGLRQGDVLCTLTSNHIDYHVIWYAVNYIGATLQTAATTYTDDDLLRRFQECKTKFIITTSDQVKRVSHLRTISSSNPNILQQIITYGGTVDGHVSYDSLLSRGRLTAPAEIDPGTSVSILLSSSGTTGLPKHVMLTHRNILANLAHLQECYQHKPGMCLIVCLAIFHHYGVHSCVGAGLYNGLKMVVMDRYNLETLFSLIQQYKAEILQIVPPMIIHIVKSSNRHKYDLSSVKFVTSAAAPLGIELERELLKTLGLKFCGQAYGLTETGCATGNSPFAYKVGSVGKAPTGVKLKIVDVETGRSLPANKTGEIHVGGPQITIGYLNNPEFSKTCYDDEGYFKTGDLGYLDSDGFLFYKDRLKELIKYKGFQVAPAYLEDMLMKHPDIADAAVIGVSDEEAGELPKAFVVRQPGSKVSENDIYKYIEERVTSYMRLRGGVEFTSSIPKTASGKILRRHLRQPEMKAKL